MFALLDVWRGWIDLAGLSLDFIGVLLLASEWRIAIAAERREAELEEREMLLRPRPGAPRPAGPHQAVFDDMRDRMDERRRRGRMAADRAARRARFTPALALIAVGFLLQIIASAPTL